MIINSSTWNDTKNKKQIFSTGTSDIYSWIQAPIYINPYIPKQSIICDLYVQVSEPEFMHSESTMSLEDELLAWEIASDETLELFEENLDE